MCTPTEACVAPGPRVTMQIPRPARELPVGVGHVRRTGFVAAGDQTGSAIVQAVEERQELSPGTQKRVGAVHASWSTRSSPPRRSQLVFEVDVGALELRLVLVGRIDVADRALPAPLRRSTSTRTNAVCSARRRRRRPARARTRTTTRTARTRATRPSRCGSRPRAAPGSRPRDACAGRRRRPAGSRPGRSARASAVRPLGQLPDDRRPSTRAGADVRLVRPTS